MCLSVSKTTLIVLATTIISIVAFPADATKTYPQVIPGPGMPSLAELGITPEQLYTTTPNLGPNLAFGNSFATLYNGECRRCPNAMANVNDVIACFNYLMSLGTRGCGVEPRNGARFVRAGSAKVDGLNYSPNQAKPVQSYCSDVAMAVQWIFNNCNSGGQVRGSNAANGNGELVVRAQHVNFNGWCP